MRPKVQEALNKIIDRFKNGDIPEAVAYSMFPFTMDVRGIKRFYDEISQSSR